VIPNSSLNRVDGITDNGQRSGEYIDLNGSPHGYITTPRHHRLDGGHHEED